MAGTGDESYWPALPEGCPPDQAAPASGTFYRFVNGTEQDWKTHHMLHGVAACPRGVPLCMWQSLSVYSGLHEALKRRAKAFAGYAVAKIAIDRSMGDLSRGKGTHHSWWPSHVVVPPPDHEVVPGTDV